MIHSNSFEAFIFDCDGVLVNSELIVQKIELEHLARHGLHYDLESFSNRFTGTADAEFFELLNEDAMQVTGSPLPMTFRDDLQSALGEAITTYLVAVPGAAECISGIAHTKAVASSSGYDHLINKLTLTGLIDLFGNNIFSADAVQRGKPAPDVFIHTAEQISVAPKNCVVLEDSVNGVLAARAAGMRVIGFTGGGHCLAGHDLKLIDAGAEHVIESFAALKIFD